VKYAKGRLVRAARCCSALLSTHPHTRPPSTTALYSLNRGCCSKGFVSAEAWSALQRIVVGCEIPGISLICPITFADSQSFTQLAKKRDISEERKKKGGNVKLPDLKPVNLKQIFVLDILSVIRQFTFNSDVT